MKDTVDYQVQLKKICKRYHVESVYVFGSRADEIRRFLDGNDKRLLPSQSDVDVGVKIEKGVSLTVREKVRLGIELEDLFDVNRVDLLVISEVDPFVAANIVRGERIYCEDDYIADEYDLYILRRAGDLVYLERERMTLALREGDRK
jgi:predicted nucleotidyltransferase